MATAAIDFDSERTRIQAELAEIEQQRSAEALNQMSAQGDPDRLAQLRERAAQLRDQLAELDGAAILDRSARLARAQEAAQLERDRDGEALRELIAKRVAFAQRIEALGDELQEATRGLNDLNDNAYSLWSQHVDRTDDEMSRMDRYAAIRRVLSSNDISNWLRDFAVRRGLRPGDQVTDTSFSSLSLSSFLKDRSAMAIKTAVREFPNIGESSDV